MLFFLNLFVSKVYSNTFEYKPEMRDRYRSVAVSGYFKRLNETCQRKKILSEEIQSRDGLRCKLRVFDLDVMMELSQNWIYFEGFRSSKDQRRRVP